MDQFAELGLAKMAWDAGQTIILNADGSVDPYANPISGGMALGQTYTQPLADHGESAFLDAVVANTGLINNILSALGADAATNIMYAARDAGMLTSLSQETGFAGTAPAGTPASSPGESQSDTNLAAAQAQADGGILGGLEKLAVIHAVIGAVENFEGKDNSAGFSSMGDAAAEIAVRGVPLLGIADGLATSLVNGGIDLVNEATGGESALDNIGSLLKSTVGDDAASWATGGAIEASGAGAVSMAIMGVSVLDAFVDSKYGSWMGSGVQTVMNGLNTIGTDINAIINDVVTGAVDLAADVGKDIGGGLADLFSGNATAAVADFESLPGDVLGVLNDTLTGIFTTLQSLGTTQTAYNSPEGIFGSKY
jgi:hypothetical protein